MKNKYMDFVPAKSAKTTHRPVKRQVAPRSTHKATRISSTTSARATTATLGVIEDLGTASTTTPAHFASRPSSLKTIKSTKITAKAPVKPVENPVENSLKKSLKITDQKSYQTPKTQFINQDKVKKRPLSKNVYRKKVEPTKESTAKKPVTIITKPEKDTKVGLIVTIILTIILGAAAGTVAFLLLPK